MDFAILKEREKNIQFYLESCSEADKKKPFTGCRKNVTTDNFFTSITNHKVTCKKYYNCWNNSWK